MISPKLQWLLAPSRCSPTAHKSDVATSPHQQYHSRSRVSAAMRLPHVPPSWHEMIKSWGAHEVPRLQLLFCRKKERACDKSLSYTMGAKEG